MAAIAGTAGRQRAVRTVNGFRTRAVAAVLLLSAAFCRATADDAAYTLGFTPGQKIKITERSNLRRYESNRFIGLAFREVRGLLQARGIQPDGAYGTAITAVPGAIELSGRFYLSEETKHDTALVAKRIDRTLPASFAVLPGGAYTVAPDSSLPFLRSFPTFPDKKIEPGDRWEAFGERVVEPLRDGRYTRVRFYCEYRFQGFESRNGRDHAVIRAQYAMRYKPGQDPYGDDRIKAISGKHVVAIYFDTESGRPSFMRDQMDEQYRLEDGRSVAYKGFILTWFVGIAAMDRPQLVEKIKEGIGKAGVPDVEVGETDEGVSLTLNKIHFVPDQAVVLPEEEGRLDSVADALKSIESRTFLVIGHTADVGTRESQDVLSAERAKTIVDYLVSQGIDAKRLLYEGRGGSLPVAPNDTEENRARNRRVEIIIMED